VSEPKPKSFEISKWAVWNAYRRVKANKGGAGVDEQSMAEFEQDLSGNLYKLWNRLSSGSYFPPPVRAVQIPKRDGSSRTLGVPTVADRIAQTVARSYLEPDVEPVFHEDSYGYRPGRSAHQALRVCRERCWRQDWVLDLDLRSFFDSVPWELILKAVAHHTDQRWILLYVERWLKAPLQREDGSRVERDRGTPQGSAISPLLANMMLHYAFECATNVERGDAVGSHLSMQCSTEDGGSMALRHRSMGDGVKPPHAALVSDCRGERCGKGALDASGGDHGDDRC
jgi:RNA-directed DNA polymerase